MGYVGGIDYGFSQMTMLPRRGRWGPPLKPITYLQPCKPGRGACNYYDNNLGYATRNMRIETSKNSIINMEVVIVCMGLW